MSGRGLDFSDWLDAMPEPYAIDVDFAPASPLSLSNVEVRVWWDAAGFAQVTWRDADGCTNRETALSPGRLRALLADLAGRP